MPNRDALMRRMERFLNCRFPEAMADRLGRFRPSMTISRQCGAGVDRIERELVEYLEDVDDSAATGWALFDQALVVKVIADYKLPVSVEPFLSEMSKFPVVGTLEAHLNLPQSEWTLFNHTAETIRKLCKMGNAIVVGRAGNFVTADLANTFHVRLVGSENKRIGHTARRHGISNQEAKEVVRDLDTGRAEFVKRYTGAEIGDVEAYHVVINTDNLTDKILVRILADTLLEWANESESARSNFHQELAG